MSYIHVQHVSLQTLHQPRVTYVFVIRNSGLEYLFGKTIFLIKTTRSKFQIEVKIITINNFIFELNFNPYII